MSVEILKYTAQKLAELPPGHPDRSFLVGLLEEIDDYIGENSGGEYLQLLTGPIEKYKTEPHTPELLTETWQIIWNLWGAEAGLKNCPVSPCDRTRDELAELGQEGRMMIYIPQEVSSQQYRYLLGRIFPNLADSVAVEKGNGAENVTDLYGWLDVESSVDVRDCIKGTDDEVRAVLSSRRRAGQTLNTYTIGSQFSKLVRDFYFDESSGSSRLIDTLYPGRDGIVVTSHVDGSLSTWPSWLPSFVKKDLPARSAGIKDVAITA